MTNEEKPLYGLADAQKRAKGNLSYQLGRSFAQLAAVMIFILAAWKVAELVGVL